jgi:hypothetical protein
MAELTTLSSRIRASLVLHGVIVVVLGLLAGFPYALVISGDLVAELRAWRMAHLEGILNGLILIAVGAAGSLIALTPRKGHWLLVSLLVAAYGNVVAATLGALLGVRGLRPAGPAANIVVFVLFSAAVVGILFGLYLAGLGALRARMRASLSP